MASRNDAHGRKPLRKKAGRFFRRLTLTALFAAAAGAGYNYYGTQQDIVAKVASVEPAPSGIIHTDRGDFINAPTVAYDKGQEEVLAIAQKLKPGVTAELHVYGTEGFGGLRADDYGLYRNITGAEIISAPAPAAPVLRQPRPVVNQAAVTAPGPAAVSAPAPQVALSVPASLINADGVDVEAATTPKVCVANDDFAAINKNEPRIARDLDIMRQLPLTGTDVYNMLKDPANGIKTCEFPVAGDEGALGTYAGGEARIGRGTGTSTSFHEYFHAMQDVRDGGEGMFLLSEKDAAVANLLTEASAVGYELASRKEAENRGLKFYDPPVVTKTWDEGIFEYTATYGETSAATEPQNRQAFDDAYNASFERNFQLPAQEREARALQAGGQAVVRRLMQGKDSQWSAAYSQVTADNINRNLRVFDIGQTDPDYPALRDRIYSDQGKISASINVVPPEYLGAQASASIQKTFDDMGFRLSGPAAPDTRTATSRPPAPAPARFTPPSA